MFQRQKQIVFDLSNSYLTINDLSDKYGVTSRTIRNDIKTINEILCKYSACIDKNSDNEYFLNATDKSKFTEFEKDILLNFEFDFSEPRHRIIYISLRFLFANEYIKLEDLIDEMYISMSTIKNDIKKVRTNLEDYNLELDYKPNHGMKIAGGAEKDIRNCISNLIYEINTLNFARFNCGIGDLFDSEILDDIYNIVVKNINESSIKISDDILNNLVIHIAIAIKRIQMNQYFKTKIEADFNSNDEYQIAINIINDIEERFDIEFPTDEITYIGMHLMGTKLIVNSRNYASLLDKEDDENIELVYEIMAELSRYLGFDLTKDKEFLQAVLLHIKPAIYRYRNGLNIRNPLLESIKENYILPFEAAKISGAIINNRLGIDFNDDELGYLAIHIGTAIERHKLEKSPIRALLVCTTGVGTSKLLQYKLEARFKDEIKIVGTSELYNIDKFKNENLDLIISTIPYPHFMKGSYPSKLPYIYIKDILGDVSFEAIEEFVKNRNKISSNENLYQKDKLDYLDISDIYLNQDLKTMEEVIHFLSKELVRKQKAPEILEELVLKRESVLPTSYGNLVAVPHPIECITDDTFLTIATLKNHIRWGNNEVQLVILLNVEKDGPDYLEIMYKKILNLIDSKQSVNELISAKRPEEIINIFRRTL